MENTINLKNKKAYFKYEVLEEYVAGVVLLGTEIKSIRNHDFSFSDSYCHFVENELYLKNFNIAEYKNKCSFGSHEPLRDRKLLLTKKQLKSLREDLKIGGRTIVPLKIFINERGICKFNIALVKGKKEYDKKNTIKDRDFQRSEDRKIKL